MNNKTEKYKRGGITSVFRFHPLKRVDNIFQNEYHKLPIKGGRLNR